MCCSDNPGLSHGIEAGEDHLWQRIPRFDSSSATP
jgi:hypothetical protein